MRGPRSSSPVLTRPTTNPNLRASETNSSIRRSFSGNPFARPSVHTSPRSFVPNTPANSPAEFGRKLPVGKEGSLRGFEEKENEKVHNLKAIKCKSPLKAGKNFMSPTISAASKFTPSPRKKILGERNEPIRTSISFSDGQESSISNTDTKSESGFNQNTIEGFSDLAGFDRKEVLKASKRVTFSDEVLPISHHESSPCNNFYSSSMSPVIAPYEVSETPNKADKQSDYDSVILDSSLDPSPAIAPLDADPSFPPYDPNTNYLSPRPQFLRYKPNRRMEVYLSKEGLDFEEIKEFEDSDITEEIKEFEDSDITEETESGDSQKESEDGSMAETILFEEEEAEALSETESGDSQKEFEDGSMAETILFEEEEAQALSETTPAGTPISTQMLKQISEAQRAPKTGFFTRSKCISLFLVLLIACVSISVKAVSNTGSPVIKDLSFYKLYEPSEVAALAKKKIDTLTGYMQQWYDSSEIAAFTRESFDGLLGNFQQWYESSDVATYANKYFHGFARDFKQYSSQAITYLSKLIPRLGEVDIPISVQFCNLTDSQEHSVKVEYFEVTREKKVAEIIDEYELKPMVKEPMVKEEVRRDYTEEKAYSTNIFSEEELEVQKMIQAEMNHFEIAEEVLDPEQIDTELQSNTENEDRSAEQSDRELQSDTESEDQSLLDSPPSKAKSEVEAPEVVTPVEFIYETKSSDAYINSESKSQVVSNMEYQINDDASTSETGYNVDSALSEVLENKSAHAILGISFLVLSVVVTSAFAYLKWKSTTAVNDVVNVEPKQSKNVILSQTLSHQDRDSQNSPTNSDMSGESCPSEMSSFQNTSSYSKGPLKAQSQERKSRANTKRESLESSSEFSTGSPSYGSFTTYERIPLKHANRDEEIVTPVRRSSRIRSQITSP